MHMSYWFGTKLENFLFYGYDIVSTWGLISTCLGLAALAILYEAMKLLQMKLHEISKDQNQVTQPVQNTDSSSLISRASGRSAVIHTSFRCYKWVYWAAEVLHWSIHVTLGYFLMLAVMTFNGYISIALILGSGVGYYIFGPVLLELKMIRLQKHRRLIRCNPECADAVTYPERRNSAVSSVSEHLAGEASVDVNVDVHA